MIICGCLLYKYVLLYIFDVNLNVKLGFDYVNKWCIMEWIWIIVLFILNKVFILYYNYFIYLLYFIELGFYEKCVNIVKYNLLIIFECFIKL